MMFLVLFKMMFLFISFEVMEEEREINIYPLVDRFATKH